jgi:putative membrane-bound dehydrogenase-like protein
VSTIFLLTLSPYPVYDALMSPFAFLAAIPLIAPIAFAAEFKFDGQTLTVQEGFEVERVAGPPVVERPVSASFDDHGRLYVTDSSGSNDKPDKQVLNPTHRVLCLEDTDGDGRFDKSSVFADKVMFPQGCLWHAGSVYVAGPPSIWKFTDTDGDGIADRREEWFKGGTLTGCANDIHGPYLGPDGYLYWTKGAFSEQAHTLGNGRRVNDRAAHIYRARSDGSDLDVIMSGGMDNPVEVAFTPDGEAIFTSTFIDFSQPGFRDGIAHAVYGGVFGKQNEVLEDGRVKRTGPDLLHPFYEAGNAAECGLCRYESDGFGPEYRDNFFATTFNLHKVTRHILRPNGATYASTDSDFLVSDSTDFHPTDVLEDADGSLLVVDTGGWYKLCCPSSQLAKPDVLGAIYRVRKKGAPHLAAGLRLAAYARIVKPPGLKGRDSTAVAALAARNPQLEHHPLFVEALSNYRQSQDDAHARAARAAAEGLGRIRAKEAVPSILQTIPSCGKDFVLEQSLIRALLDIDAAPPTRAGLQAHQPQIQRAALIALDQMDNGDLGVSDVLPFLTASDTRLRESTEWIVGHHSDWGNALAGFFRERLAAGTLTAGDRSGLERQLAQLARSPAIQDFLSEMTGNVAGPREIRLLALRAAAQASLKETPRTWTNALPRALADADDTIVQAAIAVVRALPVAKSNAFDFSPQLLSVGSDPSRSAGVRLEALAAMHQGLNPVEPTLFDFLRAGLEPVQPPTTRATAAAIIGRANLADEQLVQLTEILKTVGPLEIVKLLGAFDHASSETVGFQLIAALKDSKGHSALRVDLLKPLFARFPAPVQEQGEDLLAKLNGDLANQKAHLEQLLASLPKGDIRHGQAVFNGPKAACSTCHAIGYLGGHVGPDLTSIGQARTERDLLESIVFPSASFVRSYEPLIVLTKSGEEFSGVLRRDAPDEVLLATGPTTETRIVRSDIAEMRPGAVSVMPAGLDEQLSRQELSDLVAFLKGTKWGPQ